MEDNSFLSKIKKFLFSAQNIYKDKADDKVKEVLSKIIDNNPTFFDNFQNMISKIFINNKIVIDIDNIADITMHIKELYDSFINLKEELNEKLYDITIFSEILKLILNIIIYENNISEENDILISKLYKIIDEVLDLMKIMQFINSTLK